MFVRIFDNKGRTFDRYTVIIESSIYTMSDQSLPVKFRQYLGETTEVGVEINDEEVKWEDLPESLREAITEVVELIRVF